MSVVLLGSTSGSITLQEPAVAGTNTVNFGANTGVAILDANTPAFRNRIINGSMVLDQRNAGNPVTSEGYIIDRWRMWINQTYSAQQSTDAPTGFSNSLKVTKTSSTQSSYGYLVQYIEGFNFADMLFGTANAKTVTISFWVKSSVTGTFSMGIINAANNRTYPATYSISTANTWTQASVTIAGDTSGTWVASTNGIGAGIWFNFGGNGTNTANTWNAADAATGVTGNANLGTTNGATFYITGVQLEKGSTATSFDYRSYGTELALCQRYYYNTGTGSALNFGAQSSTTAGEFFIQHPVFMRTGPSLSYTSVSNFSIYSWSAGSSRTLTSAAIAYATSRKAILQVGWSSAVGTTSNVISTDAGNSDFYAFSAEL